MATIDCPPFWLGFVNTEELLGECEEDTSYGPEDFPGVCPVADPALWLGDGVAGLYYLAVRGFAPNFSTEPTTTIDNLIVYELSGFNDRVGLSSDGGSEAESYTDFPASFQPDEAHLIFKITDNAFQYQNWDGFSMYLYTSQFGAETLNVNRSELVDQTAGELQQDICYVASITGLSYGAGEYARYLEFANTYGYIYLADIIFIKDGERVYPV